MPTTEQLEGFYRISYYLTYLTLQPIHLVCIDKRTANLFILAGNDEEIIIEITAQGEVI
jgi:hypothetical protein